MSKGVSTKREPSVGEIEEKAYNSKTVLSQRTMSKKDRLSKFTTAKDASTIPSAAYKGEAVNYTSHPQNSQLSNDLDDTINKENMSALTSLDLQSVK